MTYRGYYYDEESGDYYLRARYYNASIGRFISEDSFRGKYEDPLSLNLYTYGHNSPIYYSDPSGHWVLAILGTYLLESGKATAQGGNGPPISVTWPTSTAKPTTSVKSIPAQTQTYVPTYIPSVSAYDLARQMQIFPNWYNQSPVVLGPTIQEEQKLKVQGFPTAEVESSKSWIYQTPTNPQGKIGENIHQTPVQNQKDIREQVITDPMSNEDKVAVISSSNLNQYQSSTEFAQNVYSQSATKQEGNTEKHHIATDKSKKYDFKNHPAFKETGINVSKDIDNLVNLANHKGRHTYKYHQEVQDRLDAVVDRYSGTNKLESAVRQELKLMKQELLNGNLDPYIK